MVGRLKRFHIAVDRWVRANPWKWSACFGILMFFVGWLSTRHSTLGGGPWVGVLWGGMFFILTAVRYCPGPGPRFVNWRHPNRD
jgi:hypothetical protein